MPRAPIALVLCASACFTPSGTASDPTTEPAATTSSSASTASTSDPDTGSTASNASPTTSDATTGTTDPGTTTDPTTSTSSTGSSSTATGTTDVPPACQDGTVDPGEACDNGTDKPDDGCGANCLRDALFVFVTSEAFAADRFKGVLAADAHCTMLAAKSSVLPDTKFIAWMSDSSSSAGERFADGGFGYVGTNHVSIVASGNVFRSASHAAPIDHDEHGLPVGVGAPVCSSPANAVWTGSTVSGTLLPNCADWTSALDIHDAAVGDIGSTDNGWSELCSALCDTAARLYCVEQPA